MTQTEAVYQYMKKHNGIDTFQANKIGVTRLSSIIFYLKEMLETQGKEYIIDEWKEVPSRYGNGKAKVKHYKVARYHGRKKNVR